MLITIILIALVICGGMLIVFNKYHESFVGTMFMVLGAVSLAFAVGLIASEQIGAENNYQKTMDFDCHENHCKVMFQIDIYTNNKNEIDRLELAESIEETVSDFMIGLGFSRTMSKPIPNVSDMSIYRISMRFEGVIGKDALVYPH